MQNLEMIVLMLTFDERLALNVWADRFTRDEDLKFRESSLTEAAQNLFKKIIQATKVSIQLDATAMEELRCMSN